MNVCGKVVLMICFALSSGKVMSSPPGPKHGLVLATIERVEFVGSLEPAYPGDIPFGSLFDVIIRNVQVVRGEFPNNVHMVRLSATHKELFKRGSRISIFMKNTTDGVEVVHWERLFFATCVPDGYWLESDLVGEESYQEKPSARRTGRSCVIIDTPQ
jgi:hypothetical protein